MRLGTAALLAGPLAVGALAAGPAASPAAAGGRVAAPAIQHVVILIQENHSFDNTLGLLCIQDARCDGAREAQITNGPGKPDSTIPIGAATDLVPMVGHQPASQTTAIDGGAMDGFNLIDGCTKPHGYACITQFAPAQIPNLSALAGAYVISDHTFEPAASASWGAHLELAASTLDGFLGFNPSSKTGGIGWGCDSRLTTSWQASAGAPVQVVPSCVPKRDGTGAFRPTPVPWVPTIMDRLSEAGLSWRLYNTSAGQPGYGWAICPTFADCLYTDEATHQVPDSTFVADADAGRLPAFSVVTPTNTDSQHNTQSMAVGDTWIGDQVQAVMRGPDWASTAIFVTYDDCGCFYDHVAPPAGEGIRLPMVIVSPLAKAAYTDPTPASLDSLLAFTEHVFGLRPLGAADAGAYDYSKSFVTPLSPAGAAVAAPAHQPVPLVTARIGTAEQRQLKSQPDDSGDTT